MSQKDSLLGPNAERSSSSRTSCDRRISRAARKLLHRHLLQLLDNDENDYSLSYSDYQNVWSLLEHWLVAGGQKKSTCPLVPSLDWHRVDEEHTIEIKTPRNFNWAYPTQVIKTRGNQGQPKSWYQCAYCGKVFSSRFYLDTHFHDKHRMEENSKFCPGDEWCRVVGGVANCHAAALEDEPYYDSGSNGWGAEGKLVKHKFVKQAHALTCNVDEIREDCHSILEDRCGMTQPHWCDSLTCPNHHHFWETTEQNLQKLWTKEMDEHPSVILVLAVFFGLLFFLAFIFCSPLDGNEEEEQIMATRRKRLASKKKRGTEITVDQAYRIAPTTNYISSKRRRGDKKD